MSTVSSNGFVIGFSTDLILHSKGEPITEVVARIQDKQLLPPIAGTHVFLEYPQADLQK